MAASILYRSENGSPRKLFVFTIYIEGSYKNRLKKVSVAIRGTIYVRSLMCYNPIGRDDTRGAGVWVLYREWLYGEKKLKFYRAKIGVSI